MWTRSDDHEKSIACTINIHKDHKSWNMVCLARATHIDNNTSGYVFNHFKNEKSKFPELDLFQGIQLGLLIPKFI